MHYLLKGSPDLLTNYEAIEEPLDRQENLFKICQPSRIYMDSTLKQIHPRYLDETLCSIKKVSNNLRLADRIFSGNPIQYTGNFAKSRFASTISDVHEGKTSTNSEYKPEDRRIIARNMMGHALLQMKDLDDPSEIFLNYLRVADAGNMMSLCSVLLDKLPKPEEPNNRRNLWSWCFAIVQNSNMHISLLEPGVFMIYESDCYVTQGTCTDVELRNMMVDNIRISFDIKHDLRSVVDFERRLDYKLRKTDFDKISAAFKQLETTKKRRFYTWGKEDRIALERLLFPSLQDSVLESYRKVDPEEIKKLFVNLIGRDNTNALVRFLDYEPCGYLEIYTKAAETDGIQIAIYRAYLCRAEDSLGNKLVDPAKFTTNPLLCGLVNVPCNEDNLDFWKHFPKVHVTLLPKKEMDREEKEKEKEKEGNEEKGKEKEGNEKNEKKEDDEEKGHYYVKQDMNVAYKGDYFAKRVDDRIFAGIYGTTLGGQAIGKQLAMFMLKNALTHYNGTDKISDKLHYFLVVADTKDVAKLCSILSKVEDGGKEIKIWKQHCVNLERNPNYIAALVQPNLFAITIRSCFKARNGCTDRDLRDSLIQLGRSVRCLGVGTPMRINLERLSMEEISEALKRMAITMGTFMDPYLSDNWDSLGQLFPPLRLLMEPADPKEMKGFDGRFPLFGFSSGQSEYALSDFEKQILRSITDGNVVLMILEEARNFKKDPESGNSTTEDFITRDFAANISGWVIKQFLQKFPDHFLRDVLKQAKLSSTCDDGVRKIAEWQLSGGSSFSKERGIHGAATNLVMFGLDNIEPIVKAQVVAEAAGITDPAARQKIAELLANYPEELLLVIFKRAAGLNVSMEETKKAMEHSFDTILEMAGASTRDPAAKIALMQPKLKVPRPWSTTELHTAIAKTKVLSKFFRSVLKVVPTDLLFRAFYSHALEKQGFFDPDSESDWIELEAQMINLDDDRMLTTMKAGKVPFFPSVSLDRKDYGNYQEIFDELNGKMQAQNTH
jgi:hypothetical protein